MSIGLIISFILLFIIALPLLIRPLHSSNRVLIILIPLMILILFLAYSYWGSWTQWTDFNLKKEKEAKVRQLLETVKGPEELINQLNARLAIEPGSARGWYLLGRLYTTKNQWVAARDAFNKAYRLKPNDEKILINYAHSLWVLNKNQLNPKIRLLFKKVLEKNPNQPDALAVLAMDAFMRHDYLLAIRYWEDLLKLVPPTSKDAEMIQKAIVKTEEEIHKEKK